MKLKKKKIRKEETVLKDCGLCLQEYSAEKK